ncbi:MarR family winged helix-turn-helix transcriptional regulator [Owenweeksia hongkongensis]|uniref:Transcriptional regulator n=1 Tax=Owenweeksia hongkongensis (strain DSM 17368 / CIP 108786 / JCM 12287 / NRRL B-23963 / UST20020801) TaxID=926562 RepID=G8QZX3_OWEHD|nr:MarR family transcriptional regulator [Owenweeksia hongkongensis]AEV32613.1 transcriptional regulator [Owenweeksia hongkongensis DSM 17368]
MKQEDTIDFHIKRTWQSIAKMYNEEASKYDATMATGYVLLNIDKEEGTPSTSLGPKMGMEATSLSRILKNMEERGLIERRKNPIDGRSVLVHLTDLGLEKRADAKQAVVRFNEAIFSAVPEQKLEIFFEVISKVNELITNRKIYLKEV